MRATGAWRGGPGRGARPGAAAGGGRARARAAAGGGVAAARDGARAGRAAVGGRADGLPAVGPRASARGVGARTSCCWRCSRSARGWWPACALRRAAGAGARARRALRAAGGRRAVDPAGGGDGRRRARRRARGAAGVALVRARAGRRRHARAQPAGVGRGRAGSSRSPPSSGCSRSRRAGARGCAGRGVPGPLADAGAVTAAATVATAPLMALYFEQVSLASLPANLAAAPAVAPVMWLGMLAIAAAQVSPALCVPLNALNGPLLAYVEWVAHVAAQPPAAALPVRLGGPVGLALTYAAGGAALVAAGRAWRWLGRRRVVVAVLGVGARRPRARPGARREATGRRPASSSSRSSTSARATRRCCSTAAPRCSSTPGRRAARSCGGSRRRASSASTRSCSPTPRPTTRGWRSRSCARTGHGSCSTAAPAGAPRCSAGCPPRGSARSRPTPASR